MCLNEYPVFSSLSKVTSQHNFSNSKEPVFRSWNKVTPQQALPVSSSKDPVFRGWNKVTPTQDLPVSNSKESTFLIVGCALIALSGVLVVVSVIFFIKAKRLKNQAEMNTIRSTYESTVVKTAKPPEYTSLNDIRPSHQQPQEIQDNREVLYSLPYT
ncbi:uncharacterized protein LOC134239901 [Saccostrea cucullata]|uniref:uncharacterized protein LOC134239901 n=1 Tax=Saccostrea cuccullata TaxID=36930 RepID=UPI002ED08048